MASMFENAFNLTKNKPRTNLSEYLIFFYAGEKFGKTSFANEFPNPAILPFEVGYKLIDNVVPLCPKTVKFPSKGEPEKADKSINSDYEGIPDWKWFVKLLDFMEEGVLKGEKLPFSNIALDTVDRACKMCKDFVLKKEGIAHESDLEWGKGYDYIKEEFDKQMSRLTKLGLGVMFIAHSQVKEFKPKNRDPYNKVVTSIPKGARECLIPMCDFVVYGDTDSVLVDNKPVDKRYLNFRDTALYEAGCRLKYMPEKIDMGNSPKEGYKNFISSFKKAFEAEFGLQLNETGEGKSSIQVTEVKTELKEDNTAENAGTQPPETTARRKRNKASTPDAQKNEIDKVVTEPEKVEEKPADKVVEPDAEVKKDEVIPQDEKSSDDVLVPLTAEEKGYDLAKLIEVLQTKTMALYKSGKLSPVALGDFIEKYTQGRKVSIITEIATAQKLLVAVKGQEV